MNGPVARWPRVGLVDERWPSRQLGVEGDDLVAPPDLRIPLVSVRQAELVCMTRQGILRVVTSGAELPLLRVSSWRQLEDALTEHGFVAHQRASWPDRLLLVPAGNEPDWRRVGR